MLRDFLKEKNKPRSECQPFLDFVAAEAAKLPDDKYNSFQSEVFNLLHRAKLVRYTNSTTHHAASVIDSACPQSSVLSKPRQCGNPDISYSG